MAAQEVKVVTVAEAHALIRTPGAKKLSSSTWAIPSRGVTVTVGAAAGGKVKLIIMKGCAC
jgi:hypothetical protein